MGFVAVLAGLFVFILGYIAGRIDDSAETVRLIEELKRMQI
jgi:site-specific recombinase